MAARRARRSAWASRPARRPSSRSASRCGPRWWWPPAASARRIERLEDVGPRRAQRTRAAVRLAGRDELGEVELKPNYRSLGPRFGKLMPLVAAAVAGLDAAHAAAALPQRPVGGNLGFGQRPRARSRRPAGQHEAARGLPGRAEGSHAVALELEIDAELRAEGWARDIVRAVQNARQQAGLQVSDRNRC